MGFGDDLKSDDQLSHWQRFHPRQPVLPWHESFLQAHIVHTKFECYHEQPLTWFATRMEWLLPQLDGAEWHVQSCLSKLSPCLAWSQLESLFPRRPPSDQLSSLLTPFSQKAGRENRSTCPTVKEYVVNFFQRVTTNNTICSCTHSTIEKTPVTSIICRTANVMINHDKSHAHCHERLKDLSHACPKSFHHFLKHQHCSVQSHKSWQPCAELLATVSLAVAEKHLAFHSVGIPLSDDEGDPCAVVVVL